MADENNPFMTNTDVARGDRPLSMYYPLDIANRSLFDANVRPIIVFTCNARKNTQNAYKIGFPIPQGLDFTDGASYDDNSLGLVGAMSVDAISRGMSSGNKGDGVGAALKAAAGATIDSLKNSVKGMGGDPYALTMGGLGALGVDLTDTQKTALGISMKAVVNPYVVTSFSSVGTRNYGFKFKMVGTSKAESDMIRHIANCFREGLYPEAKMLSLQYPPTWTIRFMMNGSDIRYLPKIWECYLTSVNVSYNGSTTVFHTDGSPLECDISVSFKETRALTYDDIRNLEDRAFVEMNDNEKSLFGKSYNETVNQASTQKSN